MLFNFLNLIATACKENYQCMSSGPDSTELEHHEGGIGQETQAFVQRGYKISGPEDGAVTTGEEPAGPIDDKKGAITTKTVTTTTPHSNALTISILWGLLIICLVGVALVVISILILLKKKTKVINE